jgi:hypothetical protein
LGRRGVRGDGWVLARRDGLGARRWPSPTTVTRETRDLDPVFVPSDVVRQAAAAVADREGLAQDRLNHAAKGFLPGPDPDARRFYSSDSLIVDVAFPSAACSR